ncbi:putative SPX domain-containing membrane protein [Cardiosporidium cionae]|uniref:SPX domain-containing membrane protein n=1 Tax=Cardiosporidium cionae TaxID=476202 RepID=A0ABQ7JF93_9APIC|nr:putative SPX domain-containing membrane protein [Cardiosporidium cionae]|eukprot:KAF8822691.1 putative SPX domain-containing membrane protein [Cardiosporidium cionae]
MVKFGRTLCDVQKIEWKGYYIDYNGLKGEIKSMVLAFQTEQDRDRLDDQIKEFLASLDFEISKAAVFYEELVEDIARHLASIRKKWPFLNPDTLPFVYYQTKKTANSIGECMRFLELNSEATRKILKKAEKLTQQETICKDDLLKARLRPDTLHSLLIKLRVHYGMEQLIDEVRDRINLMRSIESEWLDNGYIEKRFVNMLHKRQDTQDLVDSMYSTATSTLKRTRWYYGLLNQAQIDYESEPVGLANFAGLFLNNANTFLYMANYYIVIPTASEYAQAVGMTNTSSGYLLAMTPLSSLLASVLYSYWSNRCFRSPLLFCTSLLCLGNFLYALALNYRSPTMLFLGRLIVGLGGNRAVNRRYIADFVPVSARTFHSAIFVAIGSMGMSFGPGVQPLLGMLNFHIPAVNWIVNGLTAPGWLLFVLWFLFFFCVLFGFHEPERKYAQTRIVVPLEPLLEQDVFGDASVAKIRSRRKWFSPFSSPGPAQAESTPRVNLKATAVCLWIYFVLKLSQEALQTAAPLVTAYWFTWTDTSVAYLLGAIGLVVLPSNLIVGWISHRLSDRKTLLTASVIMAIGCLVTLIFSSSFSVYQYVTGITIAFLAAQVLEGINMGLLSKVMPKVMSKGLWNSGFLSTEAGTFGRVIGDVFISVAGIFGIRFLQNLIIIPCIGLLILSIFLILFYWKILVPAVQLLGGKCSNRADELLQKSVWTRDAKLLPLAGSPSWLPHSSKSQVLLHTSDANSIIDSSSNPNAEVKEWYSDPVLRWPSPVVTEIPEMGEMPSGNSSSVHVNGAILPEESSIIERDAISSFDRRADNRWKHFFKRQNIHGSLSDCTMLSTLLSGDRSSLTSDIVAGNHPKSDFQYTLLADSP